MFVDCNHATYIASAWLTKVNGMFACRVPFALLQCHDDIESTCAGRTCNHTCCEASRKPRNHYRTQISGKYWLTLSVHCQFLLNCPTSYKIAKLVACIPRKYWKMINGYCLPTDAKSMGRLAQRLKEVSSCDALCLKAARLGAHVRRLQVENRVAFCSHNSKTNAALPAAALINY